MEDLAHLSIQLLGGFGMVAGATRVRIEQPRLQRLLAYLLLHRHHPRPRQQVAFTLWPDTNEEQALKNLRTLLTRLRQSLPDLDRYLATSIYALQWRLDAPCHLDVASFEAACSTAADASAHGQTSAAIAALEDAAARYAGDLTPGWYDEWLVPERERLRDLHQDVLHQLSHLLAQTGRRREALSYAQQLLRADPLHEAAYRLLMQLHLDLDDRAAALRVYHTCATTLRNELGVDPSPATQALYLRSLGSDDAPMATQPAPALELVSDATPGATALVGRQAEWETLRRAWQTVASGRAQVVLISGEAGIGKTRLAEELLAWVARQGAATAAVARCYAVGGSLAYAPVAEWLRSPTLQANVQQLEGIWCSEVARLLPELLSNHPDLPAPGPMTEAWQRQRFFQALNRGVLGAATERADGARPLLLLLDDAQWCDRETLDWLHYLIQANAGLPLLVLATVREEEAQDDHPLTAFRLALERDELLHVLTLAPLDAGETAALAADLLGHDLAPAQEQQLFESTEGNPLFVVEMVRAGGAEREMGRPGDGEAGRRTVDRDTATLPPKVRAVIQRRLALLSPGAQMLAQTAAVLGRAFTFPVLVAASGQDEAIAIQGLDELWRRQIVREQSADTYDFSHDKIRAVAYAELSPMRRSAAHLRAAETIRALHPDSLDSVSIQIADHYALAGRNEPAVVFYRRAGAAAQRMYANAEAARIYQRLLEGNLKQYLSPVEMCELMLCLGETWRATGQWVEAEQIEMEALHIATALDDPERQVHAQLAVADVIRLQGRFDEALRWVTSAESAVKSGKNHRDMMRVMWLKAELCWASGNGTDALFALARQLEIATAIGDEHSTCEAYDLMGRIHWSHGNWLEGEECCRAALAIATRLNYHFVKIRAAVTLGSLYSSQYQFEESQRWYLQAGVLAQQYGDLENLPWAVANLGHNASERGDFPRALACLEQALHYNLMTGDRFMACVIIYAIGKVAEFTQPTDDAEQLYRHAIDFARRLSVHAYLLHMLIRLANFRLDQRRADEARTLYDEIAEIASQLGAEHLIGTDVRFDIRLLNIRLRYGSGDLSRTEAIKEISDLQEHPLAPLQSAMLCYELWRLDPEDGNVCASAAVKLQSVYAETGLYELRCQYHEVTGGLLPEPPPLPDVSTLVSPMMTSPHGLMERMKPLLARIAASFG